MQIATNIFQFTRCHHRWTRAALGLFIMILCLTSAAYANSYNYRKRITIDHNRVSSSCTHLDSFPVLIDIQTDPNLKTTAYGGHVFAAAGHDIIFEGAGGGQLDHEVLRYDGSSGSLLAFVRLPQVSSESDTVFYIRYGNSSVSSSQQNVGGVWDSNYDVVLHLQESGNGSSNEYKDSTTNGHHGTGGGLAGAGNPSYTPGRTNGLYGYAQNFDGSNDLIRLDAIEDSTWSAVTVQAWINPNDFGDDRIFGKCWGTGSDDETWLMRKRDGKIGSRMRTNSALNTGFDLAGLGTGSWYLASVTWDASDNKLRVFLNGNELASTDLGGTTMYRYPEVSQPTIGNIPGGGRDYNGQLQEARVSKVARPACWLKTEYNNQNSPSTFYSIGAEEDMTPLYTISAVAGGGGIIMPVGDMIVRSGDDQSFTITAADGYEISDVLVDGISKGVQISWTFPSVTADHNIQVIFAPIAGSSDPGPDTLLNGCGVIDVSIDYNNGFTAGTLDMINTQVDDVTGHVVLNTGFAAIDKENIVIPFDQEVFVNALYIAGRNDLGYSLLEDVVDEYGNFIGFDKIQVAKRHGFFRGTWDGNYDGGDGVFDESYAYGNFPYWSENEISEYDDGTGRPFLVNGDGVVSSRDMRKSLGVIAGGTEIVFWIVQVDRAKRHYDASFYVYDDDDPNPRDHVFFNKRLWNPDWWPSYHPDPECNPGFSPWNKVYQLDGPADEGTCHNPGGWLQLKSHDRLLSEFNLQMSNASHTTLIEDGQRYDHVIVGAPKDDPNQWILGFEQNNIQYITGSDIDCNDVVFKIERKTGGMVELSEANAITTGSADASFTGVTLGVWDYIPCVDDNDISYQLSIDNGINWVDVSNWDEVYESNANKDILGKIENFNWQPGSPAYTYRTRRIDFSGMGLSGHQIRWRANLISTDEVCEPRILDLTVDATVMRDAEVSRAGPVVKANVLYSGSYAIVNSGGAEELRGHLKATRIYDPANPGGGTTGDFLWDAGVKLNDENPSLRKILIPNITVTTITNELVGVGLGPGAEGDENKFFSSTLAYQPVLAESLIISDAHESFIDKHTDVLEGNLGGVGKIDRFSGEFSVEFHTAPNLNVPITASYNHCTTSSDMLDFNSTNVSAEMLDIDDTHVVGKGYIYDFDGNGSFDANADRHWLINWVRGFKDGASVQKDWLLGAIDHSIPALQTPPSLPDWYYGTAITKAERKSFKQFVDENATRRSVLYNGARDGMLHAFDAGAYRHPDSGQCPDGNNRGCFLGEDYGTGEELWAFIPANLIPRLKNNVLQGDDQAYVDGSPALADVYTDSQWRTVLLSAQGNGGDTIFCLDVTNPLDPKFLWEFADPDLFRSRSSPSVGKIGRILVDGEAVWVAFFVSGKTYDATLYPSIYIINIADGSVVKRVMLDSDGSGVGGVPSGQPSIINSDGNGYIDRLYIGTDKGFLYKVNVPDDPDAVKFEFSNCVINRDFTDTNEPANSVSINQRYHPIYGTPVVIVDNGIGSDGAITYDIKILFGTGDSPYYDEDIDMGNTRYHFFAYRDQAKKGECDNSKVFLDWFLELPEGHRIFASAFSSAGKIYFGTATSETEDPCDGPSTTGLTSRGDLYVMDIATGMQTHKINVGNTVITPIVYDEHLYVKASSAELQSFGSGNYDNEVLQGGFPKVEIKAWREFF